MPNYYLEADIEEPQGELVGADTRPHRDWINPAQLKYVIHPAADIETNDHGPGLRTLFSGGRKGGAQQAKGKKEVR
jgi:hypothetical protein